MKELVYHSLKQVEQWVEKNGYKGYEPFDGLSSVLRPLTFGNLFLDRLLMQVNRQSPLNLRPLLGIRRLESTIGRGYMALGYLSLFRVSMDTETKEKAIDCLDWLMENKSPQYEEFSWGKHFDFASRAGRYPKFEPITIWTALIGQAFLEAYEVLSMPKYLEVADSVSRWLTTIPRYEMDVGVCLSYTGSGGFTTIHNHSMVGAAVLARTAKHTYNTAYLELAAKAMRFSCSRQRPDGGWYYGEEEKFHWIDSFHTGYNLDALKCYIENSGDTAFEPNMRTGLTFYMDHFFEGSGRPKYYHDKTYPVDSQCAAQAIDTLANFSDVDHGSMDLSMRVARWWIDHMQDKEGYFYYRQYPIGVTARTPMLHWAQAVSYKGLALLYSKL